MLSEESFPASVGNLEIVSNPSAPVASEDNAANNTGQFEAAAAELPETSTADANSNTETKKTFRKRSRHESNWKNNKRKRLRQSGQEYTDSKGTQQRARKLHFRQHCHGKCIFKCTEKIGQSRQQMIFEHFWMLPDAEKAHFYAQTTTRCDKKRTRVADSITAVSRRHYSFRYYLFAEKDVKVRVCKAFYLSTLDISQTRVAYFHSNKQQSGLPRESQKGRHRVVSDLSKQLKDNIRNHINSIPRIASHYCRARTSKEYVEGSLNLSRLYAMYVEKSTAEGSEIAKESMYREIFNHEFNIEFQKPKSDRCDRCESFKMNNFPSDEQKVKHEKHLQSKNETRQERDHDRCRSDQHTAVICFDMQNVVGLPRANISNFFLQAKIELVQSHCALISWYFYNNLLCHLD